MAMLVKDFAMDDEPVAIMVYRYLREKVLTEATTDFALDFLMEKVKIKWIPFGGRLARRVLDPLLPEKLLALIKHLMIKLALVSNEDFRQMDSPLLRRNF